jgi:hypothetical protein
MTAAIDKLRQLDDDELDALIELAQARANSQMSKRDFLKAAGVLGTGAVLGGGAASEFTGDAQAAASTTDADGDIGTPSNPEDVFADALAVFDGANNQIGSFDETGIETPSLNTEQASITNETYVEAYLDTSITGVAAGNYTNALDTEIDDSRGEFSSNQFTPDETGTYSVIGGVRMRGGASGDDYVARLHKPSDGNNAMFWQYTNHGGNTTLPILYQGELIGGTVYELQVQNLDSSYEVESGADQTRVTIERGVIG